MIVADGPCGGGAHCGVLIGDGVDERITDGPCAALGELIDRADPGQISSAVLAHVFEGGDAEAEGAEEHGGSLQCAEAGKGSGAMEVFLRGVHTAFDSAILGAALSVDDGDEDVFTGGIVHLPESRGCGEGDLWVFVIEHVAKIVGEVSVLCLPRGQYRRGAHVIVRVAHGVDDEPGRARVVAHCAQGGERLDSEIGVLCIGDGIREH